jgi:hypothetical protein
VMNAMNENGAKWTFIATEARAAAGELLRGTMRAPWAQLSYRFAL